MINTISFYSEREQIHGADNCDWSDLGGSSHAGDNLDNLENLDNSDNLNKASSLKQKIIEYRPL